MLTFLNHFTYADAGSGSFHTPWLANPRIDLRRAELYVDVKTVNIGGVDISLESSADTDNIITPSGPTAFTTVGLTSTAITGSLGPYLRLLLESNADSAAIVTASVWLLFKFD